jgi:hypothetical protein
VTQHRGEITRTGLGKHIIFVHKKDFHVTVYAPQTKILEGRTKDEIRIFD